MTESSAPSLVEVEDLAVSFTRGVSDIRAVRGVTLSLARGETVGIVGESGSGKSVLARTIMGLTALDPGAEISGSLRFDGTDLTTVDPSELRQFWGTRIAMVFQDPMTSLNPVRSIGAHLRVPLQTHLGMSRRAARKRSLELLDHVRIPEPERRLKQYPHELSGGMRQRIMIALAVACEPDLLIADEPTTALDVTVQRQVLDLLDELTEELNMATLLITHDLGIVLGRADRVAVMYAGRLVETSPTTALFAQPSHPYTEALLGSIPKSGGERHARLAAIPGSPPDPRDAHQGCSFQSRCAFATEVCAAERPALDATGDRAVRCYHPRATSMTPSHAEVSHG